MFRKKVYAESRLPACPFCGRNAVVKNDQGVPVCESHRAQRLDGLRCACGSSIEIRLGKWGPYGYCDSCGNVSWSKVCEINSFSRPAGGRTIDVSSSDTGGFDQRPKTSDRADGGSTGRGPKEITIRSDDPEFF